jgi:hypothetical protein
MAIPRIPTARLTRCPKPATVVWRLRCSVLRGTPMPEDSNRAFHRICCKIKAEKYARSGAPVMGMGGFTPGGGTNRGRDLFGPEKNEEE